jgi:hypothetical protein
MAHSFHHPNPSRELDGPHVFGPESWEKEIDRIFMRGWLNLVQITFACGFGLECATPTHWRLQHPKLGTCPHSDVTTARKG